MKITHIEDYYSKIKEKYPDLEIWEIEKILKHGFQSFFTLTNMGADIKINSAHNAFQIIFGNPNVDPVEQSKYYINKLIKKLRINYYGKKTKYDGYYYFGLTDEEYENLKNAPLKDKKVYKIKEESFLRKKHNLFFKIKTDEVSGYMKIIDINFNDITMIAKRDDNNKIQLINA